MARAKSIPIREALRKLFPTAFLVALARTSGAVKRLRQVDPAALFWTVVLGFGVGRERTLASLRRAYEKSTGQRIEERRRAAFTIGSPPASPRCSRRPWTAR